MYPCQWTRKGCIDLYRLTKFIRRRHHDDCVLSTVCSMYSQDYTLYWIFLPWSHENRYFNICIVLIFIVYWIIQWGECLLLLQNFGGSKTLKPGEVPRLYPSQHITQFAFGRDPYPQYETRYQQTFYGKGAQPVGGYLHIYTMSFLL